MLLFTPINLHKETQKCFSFFAFFSCYHYYKGPKNTHTRIFQMCKEKQREKSNEKKNIKILNFTMWIKDFERDSLAPIRRYLFIL